MTRALLKSVVAYNHDTSIFIFATPEPIDLPVCGSLLISAENTTRPYTPIAQTPSEFARLKLPCSSHTEFALLVKRYREWGFKPHGAFEARAFKESYRPPGLVSNYIHSCSELSVRQGALKIRYPFNAQRINMIAVGAGIAPMIQALEKLLFTPGDETRVVLLYGNRSVEDILLRDVLDEWARQFPERFKVVYCVGSRWSNVHFGAKKSLTTHEQLRRPPVLPGFTELPQSSNQARALGWVGRDVIAEHAFTPSATTLTFVCGLPNVYTSLCGPRDDPECSGVLADLGYDSSRVVKF